jgi:hypothetical protein
MSQRLRKLVSKFFSETAQPSLKQLYTHKGNIPKLGFGHLYISIDLINFYDTKYLYYVLEQLGYPMNDFKKNAVIDRESIIACLRELINPTNIDLKQFHAKQRVLIASKESGNLECVVCSGDTILYTQYGGDYLSESALLCDTEKIHCSYAMPDSNGNQLPCTLSRVDSHSRIKMSNHTRTEYYVYKTGKEVGLEAMVDLEQYIDYQLKRVIIICDALETECEEIITLILQYCG